MKKYSIEEEKARRMAIKELTRVSEKIRDKKQDRLRMNQQLQKVDSELVKLNQAFEKNLVIIHGMIVPNVQHAHKGNKGGEV